MKPIKGSGLVQVKNKLKHIIENAKWLESRLSAEDHQALVEVRFATECVLLGLKNHETPKTRQHARD